MALATFVSTVPRTITTVQHPDGVAHVYTFTVGSGYTATSQEEQWILEDVAKSYGLFFGDDGYGLGAYGAGEFGV